MMRTMSVVDVSMKIWANEHPLKTGCLSVLENTFDPNLQTYTLRMEYKDAVGVKYRVARAVSPQMLASARYPHHYICSLLDEMFEELIDSKSGTIRKEKPMHIDFNLEEIMRWWADEHPAAMAYISTFMYVYDQERAIYRIVMQSIDRDGLKHGIVEEVDRSDLIGKSDPFAYILGIISEMYKKLQENTCKEKETKEMGMNCVKADNDVRLKMAKAAVVAWYNEHNAPARITMEDVYIVWFSKVLQNWKALAGTHHGDGMYYEITFDGDKDCAYVDAYKKWQNVQMTGSKLREGISK